MKNLKETFLAIEEWLKTQDADKIKLIIEDNYRRYDDKTDQGKLAKTYLWYQNIKNWADNYKEYILGDKLTSLDEISHLMMSYLDRQNYGPAEDETEEEFSEDQMSSGYASLAMYEDIYSIWQNLDEHHFLSVIGNAYDEVNLDGHRCYFLSHSKIHPLLFNYAYYVLKMDKQQFDDNICNSGDVCETIEDFYPIEPHLLSIDEVEELFNKISNRKNEEDLNNFKYSLNNLIKNFAEKPLFKNQIDKLKEIANES
jgi:hypothetical protein